MQGVLMGLCIVLYGGEVKYSTIAPLYKLTML